MSTLPAALRGRSFRYEQVKVTLRRSTQGPSWGYLKVNSSETLSIFGDKCLQNGSKNEQRAPRTSMGCPHIGPFVVHSRARCRFHSTNRQGLVTCYRSLAPRARNLSALTSLSRAPSFPCPCPSVPNKPNTNVETRGPHLRRLTRLAHTMY